MRVLYVEDNEVNQALVARVMRAKQHEVLFREEGEGALEALAEDEDIDLVLLDIELAGGMTGLDVIRTLRARNDRRPVVAITAYAMMGDRERILEAGCDQYLPKPLVIPDLLNLLEDYQQELAGQDDDQAAPAPVAATGEAAAQPPTSGAAPPKDADSPPPTDQAAAPAPDSETSNGSKPPAGVAADSTPAAAPQSPVQQPAAQPTSAGPRAPAGDGKDGVVEDKRHEPQ